MTLQSVELSIDVFAICLQHGLATEKEEIMGLLIGEANEDSTVVKIVSALKLRRSDKRADRVEISEDQLVQATFYVEELKVRFAKDLRIVGWYHSHPRITVWPSHIDLGTQAMYQRMDSSFVGLIFAVYLTDQGSKHNEVKLTCFQTHTKQRREIPLKIIPSESIYTSSFFESLIELPKIFNDEEQETYKSVASGNDLLSEEHNNAVLSMALTHIVDKITKPMMDVLFETISHSKLRLQALKNYRKYLKEKLDEN